MMIPRRQPPPAPPGDCVTIADCHCETPLRRCGNLMFSRVYEIASLIVFARNDIMTQSPAGDRGDEAYYIYVEEADDPGLRRGRLCQQRQR